LQGNTNGKRDIVLEHVVNLNFWKHFVNSEFFCGHFGVLLPSGGARPRDLSHVPGGKLSRHVFIEANFFMEKTNTF